MAYPRVLREVFGFERFLPGQEQVVEALLAGRSALAVFPTGGGKSLCFQIPALCLDGLTVVVSPLIALMKDQVDRLVAKGVAAARLDSSLTAGEWQALHQDLTARRLRLLYVAPERLASERFVASLARQRIALMAIDEAHCISEWGHNFRPDYLKLAELSARLQAGRVLALTATATPAVAADIRRAFAIAEADQVQVSFHRPNLFLGVTPCTVAQKLGLLVEGLRRTKGPAIVYVTRQQTAEEVASRLAAQGLPAEAYHAGLPDDDRHRIQDAFMSGRCPRVVATIAFGMGIDKADIRAVFHYDLPKSLEGYQQEIGRAGRDGQPAHCELLACADDLVVLSNFVYGDTPVPESLRQMVTDLMDESETFSVSRYELGNRYDLRPAVVATALTYLELAGAIRSTGPYYTHYKWKFRRSPEAVAGRFDAARRAFLLALFGAARVGRTWHTLEIAAAAESLREPRQRIIAALDYLEELGDLETQTSGLRYGYRRGLAGVDVAALGQELVSRFDLRERRDVERLDLVLGYAAEPGCLTRRLVGYFGEALPPACGHCCRCLGHPLEAVPPASHQAVPPERLREVEALREEGHPALAHPRQAARFLCGLTSPATTRARLTRDPRFGALAEVPFAAVLATIERRTTSATPVDG